MPLEEIQSLIALAESASSVDEDDHDRFIANLETYMQRLEPWRRETEAKMQKQELSLTEELRRSVQRLQDIHTSLLERALSAKEGVAEDLRELRRKGQAMKAYGDILPGRITITGKRKG